MLDVFACLRDHDWRLVARAVVICIIAVAASLTAYRRAASTRGGHRVAWIAIVALLLGSGAWATHFMAMLAYHEDIKVSFGLGLSALSLLAAIAGLGLGAAVAAVSGRLPARLTGGAICGAAMALMHFIGVGAVRFPGEIVWNPILAGIAVAIAVCGSATALGVAGSLRDRGRTMAGAMILVFAICGLHFTAMAAMSLTPGPAASDASLYSRDQLALIVSVFAGLVFLSGAGLLTMDHFGAVATLASLRASLTCAPSAIAFFDRDERLSFWSEGYRDMLDRYGVAATRGLRFVDISQAAFFRSHPEKAQRRLSLGLCGSMDGLEFAAPDGHWFQAGMRPTPDGGYIIVVTDIHEHRELVRREAEAREQAEAASRAKSEFLANMSHEIRTPLNGVLGMVQIMRRDRLEPAQSERLEVIGDAGQALLSILNNILDLSKIEAGKVELEVHPFELEETVKLAAAAYAPLAAQKDVAFDVDIEPLALGLWCGDSVRLRQVLSNLLSNALKFTSQGVIDLRVRLVSEGLAFEVADTGVGIPADKMGLIFDKFTQADASTTRRFGGTGLGLAICQQFVELMGGRLRVVSREGAGATFSFTLPLERGTAAEAKAATGAGRLGRGAGGLRILAAEDNATNRLILKALLQPFDIELTTVENGRQAVEAEACERFDLILMDVQMPELNGLEATAEIRRRERAAGAPTTPIIALTANVMRHQVDTYLAAGMDGFVAKPIEAEILMEAIEASLSPPQRTATAA